MTHEPAQEAGTVRCGDYTRGRRPPITVSRLGNEKAGWSPPWGRQDVTVYLVAFVLFVAGATSAYYTAWYLAIFDRAGALMGGTVTLLILLGVPFLAGMVTSMVGADARRDLPRVLPAAVSVVPVPAAGAGRERPAAGGGVGGGGWQLPEVVSR